MRALRVALASPAPSPGGRTKVSVGFVEEMPTRTMGSTGMCGRNPFASQGILTARHRLQVSRVDAIPNPAKVIQRQSVRDLAN